MRLDVYVANSDKIFDVECQTYDEKTIGRRVRYYQSMLDADSLLKGTDYADLKEDCGHGETEKIRADIYQRIYGVEPARQRH